MEQTTGTQRADGPGQEADQAGARPVLFCCTHSTGEAATSLALAGELARRGVPDLVFAADENLRGPVEEIADRSAVEFVSLGPVNPALALTMMDDATYDRIYQRSRVRALRARARQLFDVDHLLQRYQALDEVVERVRPALMVINRFATHAVLVALARDIPYVITAPCLLSSLVEHDLPRGFPPPSSGLPLRRTLRQELDRIWFRIGVGSLFLDRSVLRRAVRLHKRMGELGLDPRTLRAPVQQEGARSLLCFTVPGVDYPLPVPDRVRMVGALVPPSRHDERDAAVTEWLDAHPSVVYVAFGSVTRMTADQVRSLVELARRLGDDHGLLWVLHRDQQRLLPAELPANLKVVPWVHSQLGVLEHPHVRAFFTHGGSNSIHESLYFGVPVLVRPTLVDQFDHAVRAVDTGIGLTVERPDRIDVDDTHGRLLRLLHEPGFADRAREIGQVQRSAGGLRVAGDAVLMELREASVPTPSA
ncbi:glycosyltransferase [Pseudonocardia alni]|uniref:Polyene specific glycosyltransferase n=1 Tax=Pseudonocardia autotrophica TaxID=2074 RepID=A0A0F6UUE8_PSEAH|nr:glycosyltransferase [Pseudonocardia sp. SID8383]AKE78797.1 polyene specific glycosyltransferase [Pseudonocardia autotrophica]MYW75047.1 glycosyltransferase [Pseudonocardia sp. SID8383]OJG07811.1 4'-demethylrebeccamycin synthase [Pseudonocardia autotrophica]